jgi:hypothetical protein
MIPAAGNDSQAAGTPAPGLLVKAGADRDAKPFKWLDATFYVKVSGKDNYGRRVIFDTLRPEKVGPPLHLHTDCEGGLAGRAERYCYCGDRSSARAPLRKCSMA